MKAMRVALFTAVAFLLLVSPKAAIAQSVPAGTVIHPGDQISIQVYGNQTLTQSGVTVLDDGSIDFPLVGPVHVGGRTPTQAAELLRQKLRSYVRNPVITVAITQLGQPSVLILGDVKTPGKYQLRSDPQLTDALAAAGGLSVVNGDFPEARIADPEGHVQVVSLQALLHNGDMTQNIHLGEGYVVYVPGPVQFSVNVVGAVDHPGNIQVNEGDRVSAAIAQAGDSANSHSDLNHIRVVRVASDGHQETYNVNLYDSFEKGNLAADIPLQKGDVVYVPESHQPMSVNGSPLLYYLGLLTRLIP